MSNEKILKKAIEKVVKNGFDYTLFVGGVITNLLKSNLGKATKGDLNNFLNKYPVFIFSHDFAKAFTKHLISIGKTPEHQKHLMIIPELGVFYRNKDGKIEIQEVKNRFLQQMVILSDDEKFKYLEKFL